MQEEAALSFLWPWSERDGPITLAQVRARGLGLGLGMGPGLGLGLGLGSCAFLPLTGWGQG